VTRFRRNAIVRRLLDEGPLDLNSISMSNPEPADYAQLTQLIGYSVSGWGDLSTSPEHMVEEADRIAQTIGGDDADPT
jgi:hypothetical protein